MSFQLTMFLKTILIVIYIFKAYSFSKHSAQHTPAEGQLLKTAVKNTTNLEYFPKEESFSK